MWSAATLAPSVSALEADVAAQLAPVRRIERSQLRANSHRYAVSWVHRRIIRSAQVSESDDGTRLSFPSIDPGREVFQPNGVVGLCHGPHGRASLPARRLRGLCPVDRWSSRAPIPPCSSHPSSPCFKPVAPSPELDQVEELIRAGEPVSTGSRDGDGKIKGRLSLGRRSLGDWDFPTPIGTPLAVASGRKLNGIKAPSASRPTQSRRAPAALPRAADRPLQGRAAARPHKSRPCAPTCAAPASFFPHRTTLRALDGGAAGVSGRFCGPYARPCSAVPPTLDIFFSSKSDTMERWSACAEPALLEREAPGCFLASSRGPAGQEAVARRSAALSRGGAGSRA